MERVEKLIRTIGQQVQRFGSPLFKDWIRITWLMEEIGKDIFFFIGLAVAKLKIKIPFIETLLINFNQGLCSYENFGQFSGTLSALR